MLKKTLLVLAASLAMATARAQEPCQALAPELAHDLGDAALPTSESRWRAVERMWRESVDAVRLDVEKSLKGGSLSPIADLIQGRTQDLLREAILDDRRDVAQSLLGLWFMPLQVVSKRDRVVAYYLTPHRRLSEALLDGTYEMWVGSDGIESVLYSAMYLAGATDVANAIAAKTAASRTRDMVDFSRRIGALAVSHYRRWAFGPPKIWQVRGWGCDASGLDLVEFTRQRLDRSLGNGNVPYCTAPTDIDMMIAIGIANLLVVAERAPELVDVSEIDRNRLLALLRLQARFMAAHVAFATVAVSHGGTVETADFDPGTWSLHPDLLSAGNESPQFPLLPIAPKAGVGWDFSHGSRVAWMAHTFAAHPLMTASDTNWERVANGLAHQIARRVLDDSAPLPQFRNYLDGSNGWYRVNPIEGSGVPPFGLSRAFLAMPWARLSRRDPRLLQATTTMWRALAAPNREQCELLKQVYVDDSFWQHRKPAGAPISGPYYNLNLLPFLAVAPVR